MAWLILALLISGSGNFWQNGEISDLERQLKTANKVAKECRAAKTDSRRIELEIADERTQTEAGIRGIISRSELNIRELAEMDSSDCSRVVSPGGSERVAEHERRTRAINSQWLHSPGDSDE